MWYNIGTDREADNPLSRGKGEKMKGTEKQIKWAEDIIAAARSTVEGNIKRSAEMAAQHKVFEKDLEQWKKIGEQLEAVLAMIGDDAAKIIDKREKLSGAYLGYLKDHMR